MSKSPSWSADEVARLERYFKQRMPCAEMARHLPGRSPDAIMLHAKAIGLIAEDARDFAFPHARRATLLHLLDLKRAGHSPRRTELLIAVDGASPKRFPTTETRSLFGSSAASCADAGRASA